MYRSDGPADFAREIVYYRRALSAAERQYDVMDRITRLPTPLLQTRSQTAASRATAIDRRNAFLTRLQRTRDRLDWPQHRLNMWLGRFYAAMVVARRRVQMQYEAVFTAMMSLRRIGLPLELRERIVPPGLGRAGGPWNPTTPRIIGPRQRPPNWVDPETGWIPNWALDP